MPTCPGRIVRPYRLVCAVCSLGDDTPGTADPRTADLLRAVRQAPDMPLTLCCNAGEVFAWQDPGPADDTPEGPEFNLKRDLEILYALNLFPGATLPARIVFSRLLDRVEDIAAICGPPAAADTPPASPWPGCPPAESERYRKGRAKGIEAIIPPRDPATMRKEKEASLAAMAHAGPVPVRPHILACSVCQYGNGVRPPFAEDNLPELVERMLADPDVRITLAPHADWAMCAPCPYREPGLNACVNNRGSGGLPNQLRDLLVLEKLGLAYGSTVNARALYRLLLDRIRGTLELCRIEHARPSVWWTGCGAAETDSEAFARGRAQLLAALDRADAAPRPGPAP